MASIAFFITRKLVREEDGNPIITPAVLDAEGNVIIEEFVVVPRVDHFYPKLPILYNTKIGYVGKGGWIAVKQNADYYILKVFADNAVHTNVIANLTTDFGFYLGSTIEETKQTIDNTLALSQLIDSSNMTGGTIRDG